MAIVQIKCPETGEPVDVWSHEPGGSIFANIFSHPVPCPHCGQEHTWSSWDRGLAVMALQDSPDATRILVEGEWGERKATVFYDTPADSGRSAR